jgi:exodeoxyribonuclease VII small subunit
MEEIEQLSFEEAMQALADTVAKLESGDLLLEESLKLFERGQALAEHCQHLLNQATLRVEQLTGDGEIVERDGPGDGG